MAGKLAGKVVIVTGGGSGMGRALTLIFAREGTKVVVADITDDGGKEIEQMVRRAGGDS